MIWNSFTEQNLPLDCVVNILYVIFKINKTIRRFIVGMKKSSAIHERQRPLIIVNW